MKKTHLRPHHQSCGGTTRPEPRRRGEKFLRPSLPGSMLNLRAVARPSRYLINVHLTGVHLMGVHLTGVHLTGVYLTGVHLMDVHLIGVYLMGVYLTGVHLMGM